MRKLIISGISFRKYEIVKKIVTRNNSNFYEQLISQNLLIFDRNKH